MTLIACQVFHVNDNYHSDDVKFNRNRIKFIKWYNILSMIEIQIYINYKSSLYNYIKIIIIYINTINHKQTKKV